MIRKTTSLLSAAVSLSLAAPLSAAPIRTIRELRALQGLSTDAALAPAVGAGRIIPVHHGVEGPLGELDHQRSALFRKAAPKTVSVFVQGAKGKDGKPVGGGMGTGFIIRADGIVVTNAHVVESVGTGGIVELAFHDGSRETARILAANARRDLAVLQIDPESKKSVEMKWPVFELAPAETIEVGHTVMAIGNPRGLGFTATSGIVSQVQRHIGGPSEFYQTDASINPGNSGGPLMDGAGRLVGVNSAIISPSGNSGGLGFSITVGNVERSLNQFYETGELDSGYLGIEMEPAIKVRNGVKTGLKEGVQVARVRPDSPAQAGGLKEGDVILSIDGAEVHKDPAQAMQQVLSAVDYKGAKGTVSMRVRRGTEELALDVRLGKAPEKPAAEAKPGAEPEEDGENAELMKDIEALAEALQSLRGAVAGYMEKNGGKVPSIEDAVRAAGLSEVPAVKIPLGDGAHEASSAVKVVDAPIRNPQEFKKVFAEAIDDAGGWIYLSGPATIPPQARVLLNCKHPAPDGLPWFAH